MSLHKPSYRPPCRPGHLSAIIFPYKSIQPHHSQDLNSACAVPVQKIRRFKLALLLVARTVALSPPSPIPFALHTHRRQYLSSFSYRAIIFPYSRHPPPPPPLPPPPSAPPPPSPPLSSLRFHPYFHSIPSSPRFESGMRSPARKKGALKRFLLAMGTPSPTPYRVYRVPHITNAAFLLSCQPSPSPRTPNFRLPRAFSLPLALSFLRPGPHQRLSSFASHARPDT